MSRREKSWLLLLALVAVGLLAASWWVNEQVDRAELFAAVEQGSLEQAKEVLQRGVNVNIRNEDTGCSILYEAVVGGDAGLVRALLDQGADPTVACFDAMDRKTPLHAAVIHTPDIISYLIAHGARGDAKDAQGHTAFDYALGNLVANAKVLGVKYPLKDFAALVEAGADVNAVGYEGLVPMQLAVRSGNVPLARYLWSRGARFPAPAHESLVKSHTTAALDGNLEMVLFLESLGVATQDVAGDAFRSPNVEVVRHFLDSGISPNTPGTWGPNALYFPASIEILTLLIERGADVTAVNELGNTPLHLLHPDLWPEGGEILIAHGVEVDARNKQKDTPLHYAAGRGDLKAIRLLLEQGADPTAKNDAGETPADFLARVWRYPEVREALLPLLEAAEAEYTEALVTP